MNNLHVATPYFEVTDDDLVHALRKDRDALHILDSKVQAAKERAFTGYLQNALESPEAFENISFDKVVRSAEDWAEAEWSEYLR